MLLVVVLFLVIAGAIWVLREIHSEDPPKQDLLPLFARALLSEREQILFQRLVGLNPNITVLAQVALSQLLVVKPGTPDESAIRGRFKQLVADFVLCRSDFTVIAVIELDDASHRDPIRQDADRRKTLAVHAAGLRLIRIPAGPIPAQADLLRLIGLDSNSPAPLAEALVGMRPDSSNRSPYMTLALNALFIGLVAIGAWIAISQVISTLPKLVSTFPAVIAPAQTPRPASSASVSSNAAAVQVATQKRQELAQALEARQAADTMAKRKQAAWDQYYKPAPSCEHPPGWAEQVECGNQYIRARREFERMWANQVVPDSASANPNPTGISSRYQSASSAASPSSTPR